jgi:hypothetical protein
MVMEKAVILLLALFLCNSGNTGFNGMTVHSRANCANNESISWDFTRNWLLFTRSSHYKDNKFIHKVETGWQNTWRSAAVHWGEGTGGWKVFGEHWTNYGDGYVFRIGQEWIKDCSIYNGWWDKNK